MGGTWDATNVADAPGRRRHAGRRSTTRRTSATRSRQIAGGEGRDHQGRRRRRARPAAGRGRRGAAAPRRSRSTPPWRARAWSSASLTAVARRRRPAARRCAAWRGRTTTCSCRCSARTRRTTPPSRSPRSRRSSAAAADAARPRPGARRRSRRSPRPGRLEVVRRGADRRCSTPRTTRPARGRSAQALADGLRRSPGWSASSRVLADKDARGHARGARAGARRGRRHPSVVAPRAAGRRRCGALAVEVFGADRVEVAPRLADALDAAIALRRGGRRDLGGAGRPRHRLGRHRRPRRARCSARVRRRERRGRLTRARSAARPCWSSRRSSSRSPSWWRSTSTDVGTARLSWVGGAGRRRAAACSPPALLRRAGRRTLLGLGLQVLVRRRRPRRAGDVLPRRGCSPLLWVWRSSSAAGPSAAAASRPLRAAPAEPPAAGDRALRRAATPAAPVAAGRRACRLEHRVSERTLVLVKPDGVARGLVGEVLGRIERKGFRLVAARAAHARPRAPPRPHYAEHAEKPFFGDAGGVHHLRPAARRRARGPRGDRVVAPHDGRHRPGQGRPRHDPRRPGHCRPARTSSHGSDSPESAAREIALFFPDLA